MYKPSSLLRTLRSSLSRGQKNAALQIGDAVYSYEALSNRTVQCYQSILEYPSKQPFIGIVADQSIDTYAAILACWFAGKGYVPLNPQHPASHLEQIIDSSQIDAVIGRKIDVASTQICWIAIDNKHNESVLDLPVEHPENSFAYLLFTSGSTGPPKGVPISMPNLEAFILSFEELGLALSKDDSILMVSPFDFDMSLLSYLIAFLNGSSIVVPDPNLPKYLGALQAMSDHKVSVCVAVPSMFQLLQPHFDEIQLPRLRYTLFCGEALHADLVESWVSCTPNCNHFNIYGPTEASVFTHFYSIPKEGGIKTSKGVVSMGKPVSRIEVMLDPDSPHEAINELWLSGPQVMNGYHAPQFNNQALVTVKSNDQTKTYYQTGDFVTIDEDGFTFFQGRRDQQVEILGQRIELQAIIAHAKKLLPYKPMEIGIQPNALGMPEISLFIEGASDEAKALETYLSKNLPDYSIPKRIIALSDFPKLENGKTDRSTLFYSH